MFPGQNKKTTGTGSTSRLNTKRPTGPTGDGHKEAQGRQLQRSERVECSFAHDCETGGARRTRLRGLEKVNKRYRLVAAARNLGLMMLKLFGVGTPRGLSGRSLKARWLVLQSALASSLKTQSLPRHCSGRKADCLSLHLPHSATPTLAI